LITRETPKVFDLNQTALLPLLPALDGGHVMQAKRTTLCIFVAILI
jgi:hypothetical protein